MNNNILTDFYSKPQIGAGLSVFAGNRRQIGGSFLSGLARFAFPILKFLGGKLAGMAGNVAQDVIDKKPFKESLKSRAKETVLNTMRGRGVKRGRVAKVSRKHGDIFDRV